MSIVSYTRFAAPVLVLVVSLTGCSRRSPVGEQAEVSGTVLYKGKPLPGGLITFANAEGHVVNSPIDPQGHFQCQAPVGEVQIAVDNRMLAQHQSKRRPPLPKGARTTQSNPIRGTYTPLPPLYADPTKSGLKFTVEAGPQTHDIELSANPSPAPTASRS